MGDDTTPDYYREDDSYTDDSHADTTENRSSGGYEKANKSVRAESSKPVEVSADDIRNADANEAKEQYSKVTRIGSGAAVFTDMSKEPAKPATPPMPEYKFPSVRLLNKSRNQQQ